MQKHKTFFNCISNLYLILDSDLKGNIFRNILKSPIYSKI